MSLQRNPSFNLKPGQSQQEFWISKINTRKWEQAQDLRKTSVERKASTLQNFFSQSRIGKQAAQLQQHSPQTFRKNLHYDTIQQISRSNSREDLNAKHHHHHVTSSSPHQRINTKKAMMMIPPQMMSTPKIQKELPALKSKNLKQRQGRNEHSQTQTFEASSGKKGERFGNMDEILSYLKSRVEEKKRNQKLKTLQNIQYPPQRYFDQQALLYSTATPKPLVNKLGTWNLPHLPKANPDDQLHFNKTQCSETRYLKHLKDTRVVHIMRSNKEYSMGNVPSKY